MEDGNKPNKSDIFRSKKKKYLDIYSETGDSLGVHPRV